MRGRILNSGPKAVLCSMRQRVQLGHVSIERKRVAVAHSAGARMTPHIYIRIA